MHLMFVFIFLSIAFRGPFVNGLDAEHQAAYDRAIGCISKGLHANEAGYNLPYETFICDAFKELNLCLVKPFNLGDSNSRKILDFVRAYHLQRVILTRKAKLCPKPLQYQKLKELVEQSGIMERENLPSIENDTYVPCAGEVSRKCYSFSDKQWEHHSDTLQLLLNHFKCYDEETKTCDSDMARHINTVIQAFKKHMQVKHGLFRGMIEEIKP